MVALSPPSITLLIAAAAGLINIWLAFRAVQLRLRTKTSMGHGDPDSRLFARGRAHSNFNEYVPIALILMLVIELSVGHAAGLWALGALLIAGRLFHPFGLERPAPNPLRMIGILATWLSTLGLAIWALYLAFQPGQHITYF